MARFGVDISNWQASINPGWLDANFIICKATEDTDFKDEYFNGFMTSAMNAGKDVGAYHFARPGSAVEQAKYFVDYFKPYIGIAWPFLDWEENAIPLGPGWAEEWLDYVANVTGSTPGIYMSKGVCRSYDWSSVASKYPLWMAQYPDYEPVGYINDPWTDNQDAGAWGGNWKIHQYASTGRVDGYGGDLDINIFYGSHEDWVGFVGGSAPAPITVPDCTATYAEVAATIMDHYCEHNAHGYTQGSRWGNGQTESIEVGGKVFYFAGGDRDCSSGVISAYQAAGLNVDATYTGNMLDGFLATGMFEWHDMSFIAQRGDIYLNITNHTALCSTAVPDMLSEFAIAETGGIYGVEGDQTGVEAYTHEYYDYPWDGILHFIGGSATGGNSPSNPDPSYDNTQPIVTYRVKTKEEGWLPEVQNLNDYAGIPGHKIVAVAIKMNGWYQVCTQAHGWLDPVRGYDINDDENGYAGWQDSPVIAIRAYYETPNPDKTGYWDAKYRVSEVNQGYFDWQWDDETWNGQDGYAGDMNPIDRFQITLARG